MSFEVWSRRTMVSTSAISITVAHHPGILGSLLRATGISSPSTNDRTRRTPGTNRPMQWALAGRESASFPYSSSLTSVIETRRGYARNCMIDEGSSSFSTYHREAYMPLIIAILMLCCSLYRAIRQFPWAEADADRFYAGMQSP